MLYDNYKRARDAAWQILIDSHITRLPVDMGAICKRQGYKLFSYEAGADVIKALGREAQRYRSDGFTVLEGGTYYIFYSEQCIPSRQRFTTAHEVGHIVLGHLSEGACTTINREPQPDDLPQEVQANQFAARLLAPACVLNALNATTPKEISELCSISMTAAQFRAARMRTLQKRQKFLTHPLERLVIKQFQRFVVSKKLF